MPNLAGGGIPLALMQGLRGADTAGQPGITSVYGNNLIGIVFNETGMSACEATVTIIRQTGE